MLIYDLFCEFKRHFSMGNVSRGGAEHGKGRGARHHPVGRAGFGGQRGAVRPCSVISAPWGSAESLRPPLAPFGHELGAEQAPDLEQERDLSQLGCCWPCSTGLGSLLLGTISLPELRCLSGSVLQTLSAAAQAHLSLSFSLRGAGGAAEPRAGGEGLPHGVRHRRGHPHRGAPLLAGHQHRRPEAAQDARGPRWVSSLLLPSPAPAGP